MRLVIDIISSADGRFEGTITTRAGAAPVPFCGAFELVTALESALRDSAGLAPTVLTPLTAPTASVTPDDDRSQP